MSAQHDAILVAGTVVKWSSNGESYDKELLGVRSLGAVGAKGTFVDQSTLKDKTKRYISGIKDTEESTMRIALYPADSDQKSFIAKVDAGDTVKMGIQLPPASGGDYLTVKFDAVFSGRSLPELSDGGAIQEFDISYRISGTPVYTIGQEGLTALMMRSVDVESFGQVTLGNGDYTITQSDGDFTTNGEGKGAVIKVKVADNAVQSIVEVENAGIGYHTGDTITINKIFGVKMTEPATLTVDYAS